MWTVYILFSNKCLLKTTFCELAIYVIQFRSTFTFGQTNLILLKLTLDLKCDYFLPHIVWELVLFKALFLFFFPQLWLVCCTPVWIAILESHTSLNGSGQAWCAALLSLWASITPVLYPSQCHSWNLLRCRQWELLNCFEICLRLYYTTPLLKSVFETSFKTLCIIPLLTL